MNVKISTSFGVDHCILDLIEEKLLTYIATHHNSSYFTTNNIKLLQCLQSSSKYMIKLEFLLMGKTWKPSMCKIDGPITHSSSLVSSMLRTSAGTVCECFIRINVEFKLMALCVPCINHQIEIYDLTLESRKGVNTNIINHCILVGIVI